MLNDKIREDFHYLYKSLIASKINLTTFLMSFIKNYPANILTMKENPDITI